LNPLLGRQQLDKFTEFTAQKTPAALYVLKQGMCLVLRQNSDTADTGVHAIGQREINDTELATKRHSRLGAPRRQLFEA
jgi:hypothetical protein